MEKIILPESELRQKYREEELSIEDCAQYFRTTGHYVKKNLKEHKIKIRPQRGKAKGRLKKLKKNPNLGSKTKSYYERIKDNLPENEIIRRQKISKSSRERKHTWGNKISKSMMGNQNSKGRIVSQKTRELISENTSKTLQEKIKREGFHWGMKKKHHTPESNRKNRESVIKYLEKTKLDGMPLKPRLGKTEKETLDSLEKEFGYKILRQFKIAGYFLDGYIPELRIAIEIDEEHHKNQTEKDEQRQQEIEQLLDCEFFRFSL